MKLIIILMACYSFSVPLFAQQIDTSLLFKEFVTISQDYQKKPLQAKIKIERVMNYSINPNGKFSTLAEFFVDSNYAYVKMDAIQQLFNDSILIMIDNNNKSIWYMPANSDFIQNRFKVGAALDISKISYEQLKHNYEIVKKNMGDSAVEIIISSKNKLANTGFSFQDMIICYNRTNNNIVSASTIQRGIKLYDESIFMNKKNYINYIVEIGNKKYFITEVRENYIFLEIAHRVNQIKPLVQDDVLMKSDSENFISTQKFANYSVSLHN